MLKIFVTAVNAVLPIVLLIALGYFLKRTGFLKEGFVKTGNKLVFKVLLPVMLFMNIYNSDWSAFRWDIILYALTAIMVIFGLGLVTSVLATKRPERRGVMLQCIFRSNFAIIGTSLAASLAAGNAGAEGMVALLQAFSIPAFNILAVIALTVFAPEDGSPAERPSKGGRIAKVLKGIVTNPLIIAVALGLVFLGLRSAEKAIWGDTPFTLEHNLSFLYITLNMLKNAVTPFALIVMGAQFEFSAVKGMTKEIIIGSVWRVVLAPLIGIGAAYLISRYTPLLPLGAGEYPALVALFCTPVAVSSAIMAAEMKSDAQLATQYVVWTSVLSVFTIFFTVFMLMSAGLLPV